MKGRWFPNAKYQVIDILVMTDGSLFFVAKQTATFNSEKEYQDDTQCKASRVLSELYDNDHHPTKDNEGGKTSFLLSINSSLQPIFTKTPTTPSQLDKLRSFVADKITPEETVIGKDQTSKAISFLAAWMDHWHEIGPEDENKANDAEGEKLFNDLLTLMSEISGKINCSGYAAASLVGIWVKNLLDQTPVTT